MDHLIVAVASIITFILSFSKARKILRENPHAIHISFLLVFISGLLSIGYLATAPFLLSNYGLHIPARFTFFWFIILFSFLGAFSGVLSLTGTVEHYYAKFFRKDTCPLHWSKKTHRRLFLLTYIIGYAASFTCMYSWATGRQLICVITLFVVLFFYLRHTC